MTADLSRFLLADGETPSVAAAARVCGLVARYGLRTLRDRSGRQADQRAYCAVDHPELSEISARPCHRALWPAELAEEVVAPDGLTMDRFGVRFLWLDGEGVRP